MRLLIPLLILALAVSACASRPAAPPAAVASPSLDDKRVLILSPMGVDPATDSVGFNNLVRNVTQAFSASLSPRLAKYGKATVNVIDQKPQYDAGQKLAMYAAKERAKSTVVLTVETDEVNGDQRLNLQAQWVDQRPLVRNGAIYGVAVVSTTQRRYLLRGSKSGDNPKSIDDLASDFVQAMKAEGKL